MTDADVALVRRAAEMMGYKQIPHPLSYINGPIWVAPTGESAWELESLFNPLANDHDCMDFRRWAASQKDNNLTRWGFQMRQCGRHIAVTIEWLWDPTKQGTYIARDDGDLNRAIVTAIVMAGQGGKG